MPNTPHSTPKDFDVSTSAVLMVRARSWTCALPSKFVLEVMRRQPIEPIMGAPAFVLGMDVIERRRLEDAPGLLSEVLPRDVTRIGVLDQSVLVMLEAGRLLSDTVRRAQLVRCRCGFLGAWSIRCHFLSQCGHLFFTTRITGPRSTIRLRACPRRNLVPRACRNTPWYFG